MGINDEPLYEDANREGARVISERTGRDRDDILNEAAAKSEELHDRADTTGISKRNVRESRLNFRRAFEKLLGR